MARAGGFWLMLIFAAPLAVWWAAVLVYSVLWCRACAFPQAWSIAALPAPLDEWAGMIVVAIFGVLGVDRFRRCYTRVCLQRCSWDGMA